MGKSFQMANSGHNTNWHYSSCVPGLQGSIDVQGIEDLHVSKCSLPFCEIHIPFQ